MAVCVWWAEPSAVRPWHGSLLDQVERGRRDRYLRAADRDRFVLGVVLTRLLLAERLGVDPADVPLTRACDDCGDPHGPPRLAGRDAGVHVSVSHSGERVAVAVSAHGPVGVDVEFADGRLSTDPDAGIADHLLAAGERATTEHALLTYWTRKEALVKVTGDGLREPLVRLRVTPPDVPPRLVDWEGRPGLAARIALRTLNPGAGHHACLALLDHPADVEVRERFYEPSHTAPGR